MTTMGRAVLRCAVLCCAVLGCALSHTANMQLVHCLIYSERLFWKRYLTRPIVALGLW